LTSQYIYILYRGLYLSGMLTSGEALVDLLQFNMEFWRDFGELTEYHRGLYSS